MKTEWESECWLSTYLSDLFLGAHFFLVYAAHLKISPRQTNLVSSHENKISCHATKNWLLHHQWEKERNAARRIMIMKPWMEKYCFTLWLIWLLAWHTRPCLLYMKVCVRICLLHSKIERCLGSTHIRAPNENWTFPFAFIKLPSGSNPQSTKLKLLKLVRMAGSRLESLEFGVNALLCLGASDFFQFYLLSFICSAIGLPWAITFSFCHFYPACSQPGNFLRMISLTFAMGKFVLVSLPKFLLKPCEN